MGVTIHVNGVSNSLAHKGSMGFAKSTLPDVCKTPSPGGPVPIPYPVIVSMSSDLKKGTKTVKVDGKKMAAIKGSEFSRCMGDEPGTAGGVKSSTNMKEATWILYSFDVKLEGKNACRLSDMMMMNHSNTVCLAGVLQKPVTKLEKDLKKIAKKCNKKVEEADKKKKKKDRESCTVRGTRKHACCKQELDKLKKKGKHKNVEGEWSHKDCRLDVVVFAGGKSTKNVNKIYDFKFNCTKPPKMSRTQERKYKKRFGNSVIIKLVGG